METILTYQDVKTIISPQHPFVIIGERINPTRRKKLAESMSQGDFSVVQEDAIRQMEAGAQILDVNAWIPDGDGPVLLVGAAQAVMEVANRPLCFDTANPDALEAALAVYPGKALINSTTADIKQLADGILHNPAFIEVAQRNTAAERVTQVVHPVIAHANANCCRTLLVKTTGNRCWCLPAPNMAPIVCRNILKKTV